MKTIDYFLMGARTYELGLSLSKKFSWAYGDVPAIVCSHRRLPIERSSVKIHSGALTKNPP
ncbi:MAG TPA: hypothetical protein VL728_14020 [Cyclobacteriaceae bacterium]|nr:hypothetical protein [Cyclobacteriaceae bacterium]